MFSEEPDKTLTVDVKEAVSVDDFAEFFTEELVESFCSLCQTVPSRNIHKCENCLNRDVAAKYMNPEEQWLEGRTQAEQSNFRPNYHGDLFLLPSCDTTQYFWSISDSSELGKHSCR